MRRNDAPVALWSDAMYAVVGQAARWAARHDIGEYDDMFQEGCLAAAILQRTAGLAEVRSNLLYGACRRRMILTARRVRRSHEAYADVSADRRSKPVDLDAVMDVRQSVSRLPPSQKTLVKARFVEFRSFAELAGEWGAGTVKSRTQKCFETLRDDLDDGYGPASDRKRTTPPTGSLASRRRKREHKSPQQWAGWGPIPDQRDDDD